MAFIKVPGMPGKLFVPDGQDNREKKHPCRDCHACQHCSDERCALCLKKCGRTSDKETGCKDLPVLPKLS